MSEFEHELYSYTSDEIVDLAITYENANPRRLEEAINLLELAISFNNINAMVELGNIYRDSFKIAGAIELYEKAISLNSENDSAMYNLSMLYFNEGDDSKAIELLEMSAKLKNVYAIDYLGYLYTHGDSVNADINRAIELYTEGVHLGYMPSAFCLAQIYEHLDELKNALDMYNKCLITEYYEETCINYIHRLIKKDVSIKSYLDNYVEKYLSGQDNIIILIRTIVDKYDMDIELYNANCELNNEINELEDKNVHLIYRPIFIEL